MSGCPSFKKAQYELVWNRDYSLTQNVFLYIPLTYDVEEESNISDICNVVGIDRGINFVVVIYSNYKSSFVMWKVLVKSNPKHTLFVLEDLSGVRNATECVRTKE